MTNPSEDFEARKKAFLDGYKNKEKPIQFFLAIAYCGGQYARKTGVREEDAIAYFNRRYKF